MAKYLIRGSYSGDGLKGLLEEGGSKRREAAEQSIKGLGGLTGRLLLCLWERRLCPHCGTA